MGLKDWLIEKYNYAQDKFCDAVDYLRYDQGFIATSLRFVDTLVGAVASIPMTAVGKIVEVTYYGTGRLFGVSKEEMHKPIEMLENFVNKNIEKGINYLANKGVNVRFWGDVGATISHFIQYLPLGKLSRVGTKRLQGIYNEANLRYRNRLIKKAQKARNKAINDVNRDQVRRKKKNIKRYQENKALADARRKIIKEDYQKRLKEIEKMVFWRQVKDYFENLFYNTGSLLKDNFDNFIDYLFGKMGNNGFHTCPYGCGRPIPDAFKGCTELLEVFPDYFDN